MQTVSKNDFIELKFTGYSQGTIFDSNIEEDLKQISPKSTPQQTIVVVGQGMVVPGLDKALEGKEIGKQYEVTLAPKDGFGLRKKDLLKTIPLRMFTDRNMNPQPGMMLSLDDMLVKVVAVSGARVITDFNNPLSGKELTYKFTIVRKVTDDTEKSKAIFTIMFRFVPEFEVKDKVVVKGQQGLQAFVKAFGPKFKELVGKELDFELKEQKEDGKKESKDKHDHTHEHDHSHEHSHDHAHHDHASPATKE